jgi:hypothetical protein
MSVKNAALSCHRRSGYLSIAKKKKHLSSKSRQPKLGGSASWVCFVFNYCKWKVKSAREESGKPFLISS